VSAGLRYRPRENRQLRLEREILSKAAAWFARETNAVHAYSGLRGVPVDRILAPDSAIVQHAGGQLQRKLPFAVVLASHAVAID
jgi:hypothetical protein